MMYVPAYADCVHASPRLPDQPIGLVVKSVLALWQSIPSRDARVTWHVTTRSTPVSSLGATPLGMAIAAVSQ